MCGSPEGEEGSGGPCAPMLNYPSYHQAFFASYSQPIHMNNIYFEPRIGIVILSQISVRPSLIEQYSLV